MASPAPIVQAGFSSTAKEVSKNPTGTTLAVDGSPWLCILGCYTMLLSPRGCCPSQMSVAHPYPEHIPSNIESGIGLACLEGEDLIA